jgi:hypothetical protein
MTARGLASLTIAFALAATAPARGTDVPPEVVAKFTRQVQPLLVNRCAAGACHGGPAGHEPRFERGPASARPDRLDTLTNMQDQYFAGVDLGVLFDGLLDDLLRSTGSAYGFIAQVLVDADGRFIRTWAMTDISWNDATRAMYAQYGPRGMEFHNLDTLFGLVITTGEAVISNEPLKDPRAAGRPNGHPPLDSFFGF